MSRAWRAGPLAAALIGQVLAEWADTGYWPPNPGVVQPNHDAPRSCRCEPPGAEHPHPGCTTPERGVKPLCDPHSGQQREIPRKRPS